MIDLDFHKNLTYCSLGLENAFMLKKPFFPWNFADIQYKYNKICNLK